MEALRQALSHHHRQRPGQQQHQSIRRAAILRILVRSRRAQTYLAATCNRTPCDDRAEQVHRQGMLVGLQQRTWRSRQRCANVLRQRNCACRSVGHQIEENRRLKQYRRRCRSIRNMRICATHGPSPGPADARSRLRALANEVVRKTRADGQRESAEPGWMGRRSRERLPTYLRLLGKVGLSRFSWFCGFDLVERRALSQADGVS